MVDRIAESRKRSAELKKNNVNDSDEYQQLQDSINALRDYELNLSDDDPVSIVKKTWKKRPDNRHFIASEFFISGADSVIRRIQRIISQATSYHLEERFEKS